MRIRDFIILGFVIYLLYLALKYIKKYNGVCMGCSDCSRCRSKFCEKKDNSE